MVARLFFDESDHDRLADAAADFRKLGVTEGFWQGALVSSYALMVGIFALVIGPISDRVGRRRVLLAGTSLMAAALALHFLATTFEVFLFVRILAGVAGGVLTGSAASYVGDYFPNERRGWAQGWIMSSTALGQIAGVPLGIYLAGAFDFRTPFLMFALTMLVAFLLVWWFVPQPQVDRATHKLTVAEALRKYWQLLHRPEVVAGASAYTLMFLGYAFYIVFLPKWLAGEFQASANQIASLFLVGGIANAVTAPVAGKLSDKIGRKGIIVWSSLAFGVVILLVTFVVREFWMAYPLFFVTMILIAARMSPFQALMSSLASGAERGTLLSLVVSIGQLGFSVGGTAAGFAYTRFGYRSNTVLGAASVVLMAFIVWRYLPEPKSDTAKGEQPAPASTRGSKPESSASKQPAPDEDFVNQHLTV
jgi:predicted MFS family arabinose efflux permease